MALRRFSATSFFVNVRAGISRSSRARAISDQASGSQALNLSRSAASVEESRAARNRSCRSSVKFTRRGRVIALTTDTCPSAVFLSKRRPSPKVAHTVAWSELSGAVFFDTAVLFAAGMFALAQIASMRLTPRPAGLNVMCWLTGWVSLWLSMKPPSCKLLHRARFERS